MKKFLLILTLLFSVTLFSPVVLAGNSTETEEEEQTTTRPVIPKPDFLPGPDSVVNGEAVTGEETQDYVLNTTVPRAINLVLGLFGIGTFLAIVLAAVNMLIAWGNEDKVTKAKKNLTYALIGFVLSLFAYAIVSIIVSLALPRDEASEAASDSAFLEWLAPSAHASDEQLDVLLPSQYELIESQGGTEDTPGRGVSLPSGDLITEVVPAIVTNLMFAVGFLIFVGFVYGGILLIYGRGNEEHVGKAKTIIVYSAIALGLLGFGYAIVYGIATINFDEDSNSNLDDVYVEIEEDE